MNRSATARSTRTCSRRIARRGVVPARVRRDQDVPRVHAAVRRHAFKFVATATPSPNEYIELLAYAAFLEVMDVGQAKTRFFKRNSEKPIRSPSIRTRSASSGCG
jgi:hypothetical protein